MQTTTDTKSTANSVTKYYFSTQSPPLAIFFFSSDKQELACCAHKKLHRGGMHCHHCWNAPPTTKVCGHPLFGLHLNIQQASVNVNECSLFPRGGIQWCTFPSYALSCQTPICHAAPLLPSVTQKQNGTEYCREGSTSAFTPPRSAYDFLSEHNKIRGIIFRASLV